MCSNRIVDLESVVDYIEELKINCPYPDSKHYYTQGGCFKFYEEMKKKFPQATPLYDGGHVVVLIDNNIWDITGLLYYDLRLEPRIFNDAYSWAENYDPNDR